ncbi:MAG TPA: hypothetical protein VFZ49_06785 [Pyrinomonadaceae bacterium]
MDTRFIKTLLLVTLVWVFGSSAVAQTAVRIQFAKGKSSASIQGSTGKYGVTYVIRARSGQKLVLDVSPAAKVGVKVETNGRYGEMVLLKEEHGGHYEVGLEETGDYTIFIGSTTGGSEAFSLKVAISRLADI